MSLYMFLFTTVHLVHIHWITANSIVIGVRETLSPEHPVRQLLWPHTHGTIAVNYTAINRLVGKGGAVVRATGLTPEGGKKYVGGTDVELDLSVINSLHFFLCWRNMFHSGTSGSDGDKDV